MVKKKAKKKSQKATKKSSAKKAVKKTAKKISKPKAVPKKKVVSRKSKKPVSAKPAAISKKPVSKKLATKHAEKKKAAPSKPAIQKTKRGKAAPPPVQEQKPKGSPTQLSMALEEKETKQIFVKPRITRSKSGNLSFQLEYTIRSSPAILYEFLNSSSGLAQWFADSVDINDHHCSFVWEGVEESATIIDSIPDEYIRYRWDNSDEDEYFEFRITKNEITGDTVLTITDFASESEIKDQKMLWDSQVKLLTQQVGG